MNTKSPPNLDNLFWSKVLVQGLDECWPWQASKFGSGYGSFGAGRIQGIPQQAHRVAYLLTHGTLPKGVVIRHTCNNRPCCNPTHLIGGTHQDNSNDKVQANRQAKPKGINNGRAKLTDQQVLDIRDDNRSRLAIAKDYKISRVLVGKIKRKENWSHLS